MSTESLNILLRNPQEAYQQILTVWQWIKAMLIAGHRVVLFVRLERRSDAQNRLLHSRLGDVSKHCEWAGDKRDVGTWKRLFTSAWLRTQGEQIELLPALDGHGVDIVYASTTKLTRAQCVELSDYIMAWGSEREVPWCAASLGRELIDAETGEIRGAR